MKTRCLFCRTDFKFTVLGLCLFSHVEEEKKNTLLFDLLLLFLPRRERRCGRESEVNQILSDGFEALTRRERDHSADPRTVMREQERHAHADPEKGIKRCRCFIVCVALTMCLPVAARRVSASFLLGLLKRLLAQIPRSGGLDEKTRT